VTNCQPPTLWGGKDLKWGAQIRDISVGGVSLVLRRRFERGAGLAIELPGSPDGLPNTVLARVVHVRPQEGGVWVLGCSFVSPLSEEEVATLLPRPSAQPRVPAPSTLPPTLIPGSPAGARLLTVLLRGMLPSGEVIWRRIKQFDPGSTWPRRAGTIVNLKVSRGGPAPRLQIDSCQPHGEGWLLSGTFLDPVPF